MSTQPVFFNKINCAPLADVFLVLLVVMFLLPNLSYKIFEIDPPYCDCGDRHRAIKTAHIDVMTSGRVTVNGQDVGSSSLTLEAALDRIKSSAGASKVDLLVRIDADALHKDVVRVLDAASGAQVGQVRLLTIGRSIRSPELPNSRSHRQ